MKYVFDPEKLHEAAKKGVGLPHPDIFIAITNELAQLYPGKIETEQQWVFNNAGGAMGVLTFLYASPWEYLIFFGSPIGTSGHSGRYHFIEDYAYIIDGEFWYVVEGNPERKVYKAGDKHELPKGQVFHYKIPENGWILEYARGPIITMLPFGLIEIFTSTLDWKQGFQTMKLYTKLVLKYFKSI